MIGLVKYFMAIIESFLLCYMFSKNQVLVNKRIYYTAYFCYTFLVIAVEILNVSSILRIIICILFVTIVFMHIYKISLINLMVKMGMFLTILGAADYISIGMLMQMVGISNYEIFFSNFYLVLSACVLSKMIVLGLLFYLNEFRFYSGINKRDKIFVMFPIAIGTIVIFFLTYRFNNNKIDNVFLSFFSLIVLMLIVLNFCICQFYLENKRKVLKFQEIEVQEKHRLKYYQDKSEVNNEILRIYHDLNNYLYSMKEKENFLFLQERLKQFESFVDTGNPILDSLVNDKYRKAIELSFEMECHINFENITFLESLDICAIFGNLLDNALEYGERILGNGGIDPYYISVKANKIEECVCIVVINTIKEEDSNKDFFRTVKEQQHHGIGLKSIKKSVAKYNGNIEFKIDRNEFKVIILIPFPDV